ncbi:SDR family NAD(P)-dependent oxidoreductase [Nocardioides ochotonae]|uniref:SDR family NAD(P)-dependent oxidoreductase n=1 Tax=Nocardioides ochotonae TaxID=2685869 RepID=UPI0014087C31|nr:SDR family oxidoreductase [Nocardioides ochotonae]
MSSEQQAQRVVVVTGAASGVGYATAEMFRDAGEIVFGLDRAATAPEGVTYVECDVSSKAAVDAAIEVCGQHGRIDVLANVAGIVQFGRFEQISEAELDRVLAVNLKGPFLLTQAALPLLEVGPGCVVNVASVAGRVPQPYAAAYGASKGGLVQLTKNLALELASRRIRVNAVCPGTIDTPMVVQVASTYPTDLDPKVAERLHMQFPGTISPQEVAESIRYLSSPQARFVTGEVLAIDGFMS